MEKIYHSLTELIGRTPLLEISHIEKKEQLKARVLVKLESFNPGGSVKDRAAFYMIEAAEKEGLPAETRASDLPGLPRSKVTGSRSPCLKP